MTPQAARHALYEAMHEHTRLTRKLERNTTSLLADAAVPAFVGGCIPGMERSIEALEARIAALKPIADQYQYAAHVSSSITFAPQRWYPEGTSPAPFDPGPIPEFLRRDQ